MSLSAQVPLSSSFRAPVMPAAQISAVQTTGSYGMGGMGSQPGADGGSGSFQNAMRGDSGAPMTQENVMRGDLTGDLCVTIDLFSHSSHGLCSAIWREKTNESILITGAKAASANHAIVSMTAKGESMLKEETVDTVQLDALLTKAKADIIVGEKQTDVKQYSNHYPTQQLHSYTGVVKDPMMELTLSLLIAQSVKAVMLNIPSNISEDIETKPSKKSKKAKKAPRKPLTFVVPCSFDQPRLQALLSAAKKVESSQHVIVKNFFNRGVSVVAGALYRSAAKSTNSGSSSPDSSDLKVLLNENLPDFAAPIVFYFNVSNITETATSGPAKYYYDACLVQCEEGKRAVDIGNMLGYERLATLATTCGLTSDEGVITTIKQAMETLLLSSHAERSLITVVLLDGKAGGLIAGTKSEQSLTALLSTDPCSSSSSSSRSSNSSSNGAPPLQLFKALSRDAAIGASLLSAAELDSSKQYMNLEEGWKIGYQLPVADGILQGVDVAVQVVEYSKEAEANQSTVAVSEEDCAFRADSRLWKSDVGNLTQQLSPPVVVTKVFQWGSAYLTGKNHVGWPKVYVSQRVPGAGGEWSRIATLTPLATVAGSGEGKEALVEAVKSCTLVIQADRNTGIVVVSEAKGDTLKAVRKNHFWIVQLMFFVLLPFILYLLYHLVSFVINEYYLSLHRAWLTDFYLKNAPQKLLDPTNVAKTIKKYEGKMFLLWRALEKTYKVKWLPPTSIVDEL